MEDSIPKEQLYYILLSKSGQDFSGNYIFRKVFCLDKCFYLLLTILLSYSMREFITGKSKICFKIRTQLLGHYHANRLRKNGLEEVQIGSVVSHIQKSPGNDSEMTGKIILAFRPEEKRRVEAVNTGRRKVFKNIQKPENKVVYVIF